MSKIYLETADVLAWTAVTIALSVLSEKALLWAWERFCKWEPDCRGAGMSDLSCKPQQKALRLEHVCKSYGVQQILNDFCAAYDRGSTTYFTTPSGSGKTTLFRMIAGLEKPDAGEISCGGSVAMVFQEDRLCEEYSALKNVEMITGDRNRAREHLLCLLEEGDITRPCKELSGGMKRRVAIARAFASQSDILLLDEPFTGLDQDTMQRVQCYMEQYRKERTLLIATHIGQNVQTVERCGD